MVFSRTWERRHDDAEAFYLKARNDKSSTVTVS